MKKLLFPLVIFALLAGCNRPAPPAPAAAPDWPDIPQVASYNIEVTLDADAKTLTGHETITYLNTTDIPIPDAVFHLYLNAFRDQNSIFLTESGTARGYAWDAGHPGWIEVTGIRLADGTPLTLESIEDGTLARVQLPSPVPGGESFSLEVDFRAQLPKVFARTGFFGDDFFMIGQWFPKLGVWQPGSQSAVEGWNAYPFHANSEFFADFGTYDVAITLPTGYVTGATGLPVAEKDNGNGTQTVSYHAQSVIDFSWTASPNFRQTARTVNGVEVVYFYLPEHSFTVERALDAAEAAVTYFGEWYGAYPYPRLLVVDVPDEAGGAGGMEYPMLVTAGLEDFTGLGIMKGEFDRMLELVTVHEIGHEWWYATAAFNEAEEPWLDEGFTDYSTVRLMGKVYGPYDAVDAGNVKLSYQQMRRMDYLAFPNTPMYGKAWDFNGLAGYGVAAYAKPALALTTLENILGEETMLEVMSTFYQRYQFQHPTTDDFRLTAEEVSGQDLDWFFDGLVYGDGALNYSVSAVDEHSVTVMRQGELVIPTEVEVTFSNGSAVLEPWGGGGGEQVFTYPDKTVIRAEIDPGRKIVLDTQWSDNGLSRRMDIWSWLAINTRLFYQLQNWMLYWGGL